MCKKQKGLHNRIDKCMKPLIHNLNLFFPSNIKVVACCCGHKKYSMTIIIDYKYGYKYFDLISDIEIPRTRKFYVRDKQGYYYIPEVSEEK